MIEWAILMGAAIIASALGKKEMDKRKNFSVKDYVQTREAEIGQKKREEVFSRIHKGDNEDDLISLLNIVCPVGCNKEQLPSGLMKYSCYFTGSEKSGLPDIVVYVENGIIEDII